MGTLKKKKRIATKLKLREKKEQDKKLDLWDIKSELQEKTGNCDIQNCEIKMGIATY